MGVEKCEVCGQLFCSPETVAECDRLRAEKTELIAALQAIANDSDTNIEAAVYARSAIRRATAA